MSTPPRQPLLFTVRVKPGSRRGPLVESDAADAMSLTVYLRERPVEGQANEALLRVLAQHFGVRPRDVDIVRGTSSRVKHVRITADR
ncbi:DUF167 domain-containing protein [Compostimonas suwonensis]|uniref:DUF167 domain-containing protein n=1 Tax=Compostimonas suwonensis TaxID=1048394 RepID=UPI001FE6A05A|nr:DUF167 domain-containing protein [Compostimonas suwonensis]